MAISVRSVTESNTNGNVVATVTTPGTTQTGDLLLIFHSNDYYTDSELTLTGTSPSVTVNAIATGSIDAGDPHPHIHAYWAVATSSEAYTVNGLSAHGDEEQGLAVYVLSGADTTSPIDIANAEFVSTNGDVVVSSISPSTSDALLVIHIQPEGFGTTTYTPPGSMTLHYDNDDTGFMQIIGASEQLSASGATGTRTFTRVRTDVPWAASTIAIKTASAGGGDGATTAWLRA